MSDELFTAERRYGAFFNNRRCRVSARRRLEDCVIATSMPHFGRLGHGTYLIELRNIMMEVAGLHRFGAAALDLAYVASGRTDGFWEDNLQIWDMAAGILMVREAGGFVTDKEGGSDIFRKKNIITTKRPKKQQRHQKPTFSPTSLKKSPPTQQKRLTII